MNVLCDDMEEIGFRDGEQQRRAKPSGTRLIDSMAATDEDRLIWMFFSDRRMWGGFLTSAEARSPPTHYSADCAFPDRCASDSVIQQQSAHSSSETGLNFSQCPPFYLSKTDLAHTFLSNRLLLFLRVSFWLFLAPRLRPKFCLSLRPVGRLRPPLSLPAEDWNIVPPPRLPHCDEWQEIIGGPWQSDYQSPWRCLYDIALFHLPN